MGRPQVTPAEIARWCARSTDSLGLRRTVVARLRAAIGFDGAFFATTDPATLLYTSALRVDMPVEASVAFIRTELAIDDVNQLRTLARAATPVGWLDAATRGDRGSSARYREAMRPLGLGDELRVALRADGHCWGLLCLHRSAPGAGFDARDARLLGTLAPRLAEGLRRAILVDRMDTEPAGHGPGVAVVSADWSLRSRTPAAARWWDELAALDAPRLGGLPTVVRAVVQGLRAGQPSGVEAYGAGPTTSARVRTPSGQWLVLHASYLDNADRDAAVVIEPAGPALLAPLVVAAYGLTAREAEVAQRVLAGLARKQIASELRVSLHTVNDHIKSIFDKTDVSSAGQLRARMFSDHFAPRG